MSDYKSLRPQDILVLLRLLDPKARYLRQLDLGYDLGLSASEVGNGIARLIKSKLIRPDKRPFKKAIIEFLLYGVKYFYPVEPGALSRGVPTAHSARPLNKVFSSRDVENRYVWPSAERTERGQAIHPLYKSAPDLIRSCPQVYELLTLIDAIRVGRARERQEAEVELVNRINELLSAEQGELIR